MREVEKGSLYIYFKNGYSNSYFKSYLKVLTLCRGVCQKCTFDDKGERGQISWKSVIKINKIKSTWNKLKNW